MATLSCPPSERVTVRPPRSFVVERIELSDDEVEIVETRPALRLIPPPPPAEITELPRLAAPAALTKESFLRVIELDAPANQPLVVQASLPPSARFEFTPLTSKVAPRGRRLTHLMMSAVAVGGVLVATTAGGSSSTAPAAEGRAMSTTAANDVTKHASEAPAAALSIASATRAAAPSGIVPVGARTASKNAPVDASAEASAEARAAMAAADFDRATAAYQRMLAHGGSDFEALAGLGRVAQARGQTNEAVTFFERCLERQPGYLPARLGAADVLWDAGRRDAAAAHYREIRARYANDVYPVRVLERSR